MKSSFILYNENYELFNALSDEDAGKLIKGIFEYENGIEPKFENYLKIAFIPIKQNLDRNRINNHWNWKGGISSENHKLRNSVDMKNWRNLVFNRDNFICQRCFKKGGELNAHHIIPFSVDKGKIFDIDNGVTLCKKCHINLHKKERSWLNEN